MESPSLLVMTASINPKNIPFLKITSPKMRLEQYLLSLIKWILETQIDMIVFCENTNFSFETNTLNILATAMNKRIEFIRFDGNKKSSEYGKGYGEGEIIEYAMKESLLVREADSFFKVTGRFFVKNFNTLLSIHRDDKLVFHLNSLMKPNQVCTKFYKVNKKIFSKYLLEEYKHVRDKEGYYLEHVYYDIFKKENLKPKSFKFYPKYEGFSGTTGALYSDNKIRRLIKDILSLLGFYRVKV